MEMTSKYIVVPIEEYKELLKIKLEGEIKAQYDEQIEDLKLEIQSLEERIENEQSASMLWWKKCKELEKELEEERSDVA